MARADDGTADGESDSGGASSDGTFLRDVARIDSDAGATFPERPLGSRLGRFVLRSELGRGGMGIVYRAHDATLGRSVALKVLPSQREGDPQRRARFLREARSAASVVHPNVATIYEVGEAEASLFIAMELVAGTSLRARFVAGRPLPAGDVVPIAKGIARALAAAHAKGIVHRDLKPENVMVDDGGLVKVLDFGLAKLADARGAMIEILEQQPTDAISTAEGLLLGTPAYMSPEQAAGKPLDARSDLFSLGIVLYEALTGGRPFVGETIFETLASVMRDTPAPLSSVNPDVPADLAALVARCLAKAPHDRPASANELLASLENLDGERPSSASRVIAPAAKPRRRVSVAAVALLASLAVGAAAWGVGRGPKGSAHEPAPAASGSASPLLPLQPTDFPPPKTESAEALAEYRNSWRDYYDATRGRHMALLKALDLDPTFAAAQLRMSFETTRPVSARFYREAVRHREKLDERDRALLLAYEPCEVPILPDLAACERRFVALHGERPTDLEVLRQLAIIRSRRDPVASLSTFEELGRLDPRMAAAESSVARLLAKLGKRDEARRHYQRCSELSPLAGECREPGGARAPSPDGRARGRGRSLPRGRRVCVHAAPRQPHREHDAVHRPRGIRPRPRA